MSAQSLNVRVGLIFDEKSLASIERSMRASGQRLSKIGGDLSLSLSLPLAAFGVTAIKSAGDIESLTLALKSQLGTADAAAKELNLLTEAAKNPGLGVEQAVRGSVRLQGVGFAAEDARKVLIQMGNAIAATGGSAQELDAVTKQFAQMTSKGRVLQEDVSVLSENMPGLAQLMQKAFGTQSVEAIRAMGITGKEFVLQVTKAAEALPRVESGIKNGIGNAIDSLKQSAAKVGFAINEAFNVTGVIETVSGAVLALAQGFASLSPAMQKTILGFGGMLVAIGPLIKAKGALQLASSQLVGTYNTLTGAGSLLGGITRTLYTSFIALNTAAKAFVVIGLVTAVIALADSWGWFNKEATTAQKVQQSVNDAMKSAEASISAEKGAAQQLISVLQDETTSRKAKAAALNDLKKINPEYFGQLRLENGAVIGLTEAYGLYISNLLLAARAKKAEGRLVEIDEKKADVLKQQAEDQKRLNELQQQAPVRRSGFTEASQNASFDASGSTAEAGAIAQRITASKALVSQLDQEAAEYDKIAKAGYEAAVKAKATVSEVTNLGGASDESSKKLGKLKEVLNEVNADIKAESDRQNLRGLKDAPEQLKVMESGLKKLLDAGWKPNSSAVLKLVGDIKSLSGAINNVPDIPEIEQAELGLKTLIKPEDFDQEAADKAVQRIAGEISPISISVEVDTATMSEAEAELDRMDIASAEKRKARQQEVSDAWKDASISAAQSISDATFSILEAQNAANLESTIGALEQEYGAKINAAKGNKKLQEKLEQELQAKIQAAKTESAKKSKRLAIIEAAINTAVAVTKALSSAAYPINIALAIAAGVAGAAQIAAIQAQPLYKGTKDFGGGLALVGERGPELVNMPKHSQVFPTPKTNEMLNGMGGGAANIMLGGEFTVKGTDLVLVLDRATAKNERYR